MEKEKTGRLVLNSNARMNMSNSNPAQWQTLVDMGNFSSNQDDMITIEIDYITPIFMSSTSTQPTQFWDSLELVLDFVPQQYSYDNGTQTSTQHLAFLEKNFSQTQSKQFSTTAGATVYNIQDPQDQCQVWNFTQKPSKMVVRPEVLQSKLWQLRLKFIDQPEPSNVVTSYVNGGMSTTSIVPTSISDYKIVVSCSK